jgi:hypothetical protein
MEGNPITHFLANQDSARSDRNALFAISPSMTCDDDSGHKKIGMPNALEKL